MSVKIWIALYYVSVLQYAMDGMSEDEAKKVILELTMLQIFAENFGVEI